MLDYDGVMLRATTAVFVVVCCLLPAASARDEKPVLPGQDWEGIAKPETVQFSFRLTESLDSRTELLLFAVTEWIPLSGRSLNDGASTPYGWIELHLVSPQ